MLFKKNITTICVSFILSLISLTYFGSLTLAKTFEIGEDESAGDNNTIRLLYDKDPWIFVDFVIKKDGTVEISPNRATSTVSVKSKLDVKGDVNFTGTLYQNGVALDMGTDTNNSAFYVVEDNVHSFSVGDILRYSTSTSDTYALAQANSADNAEVVGIVSATTDNSYTITTNGYVEGLSDLTAGKTYFLATTTTQKNYTKVEPQGESFISKPLFVATSDTTAYFLNLRGIKRGSSAVTVSEGNTGQLAYYSATSTIASNNKIYFDGDGDIGIGTTSPTSPIHLGGNTLVDGTLNVGGQFSVNTDGIVTAGKWNANTIGVQYGGTGTTTLTSNGVLYGNGTGVIQTTSQGGDSHLLISVSGVPTFVAMSGDASISNTGLLTIASNAIDGTNISLGSDTQGDIMYYDNGSWTRLAAGTAGQFLKSNGTDPTWENLPTWVTTLSGLDDVSNSITTTTNNFLVATEAQGWVSQAPATARTSMGLGVLATLNSISSSSLDAGDLVSGQILTASSTATGGFVWANPASIQLSNLTDINTSGAISGNILMADGTDWESVSSSTVRTNLGLDFIEKTIVVANDFQVGDILKYSGGVYGKAQANKIENAEVIGIVSSASGSQFTVKTTGYIDGLSGLTAGETYFLATSTEGEYINTDPQDSTSISKPLFVATSDTTAYFLNLRGVKRGTSAVTVGVGAQGQAAYYTTNNTVSSNSNIYFDGGNVGIGTSSPQGKLHIHDSCIILKAPNEVLKNCCVDNDNNFTCSTLP